MFERDKWCTRQIKTVKKRKKKSIKIIAIIPGRGGATRSKKVYPRYSTVPQNPYPYWHKGFELLPLLAQYFG